MPVLAVALDAADRHLVERWAREGQLPTLARLLDGGASTPVATLADYFPEAVWPTLTTGCGPGKTGHYNFRCIPPGSYAQVFSPGRNHRRHFWHLLVDRGCRVLLVDIPYADLRPDPRIVQLNGWGQRGALQCESWPSDLEPDVIARHGPYPHWLDQDFDRSLRAARHHLREALRMADVRTELFSWMLREHPWDLALVDYWEPHCSSHAYHRYLDPSYPGYDERRASAVGNGLLEIYQRVDDGLGRLLAELPEATDVLVFSPYGSRPNGVGREILRRTLLGLGYEVPGRAPLSGRLAQAARAWIPWSIRRHVNARLSPETQMRVLERMFADALDWSRTRAFPESDFGYGWIRVNLRGREPRGIVSPGPECDALCDEIGRELRALTDASSGRPAVAEVVRSRELFDGPHVGELPDLLVRWEADRPLRAARHPKLGVIEEDWRDIPMTEHHGDGFLIATGPSIRAGAHVDGAQLVDLAPTLLYLCDAPTPDEMDGRVLEELIDPGLLASRPAAREPIAWEDERWPAADAAG